LFFPIEAIYVASVKLGLVQELMRLYKVTMASPASIGVLLNSLQMGFRTLEIQEKSGDVWRVLTEVRSEVDNYEEVLLNLQKRLEQSEKELDMLVGRRTRMLKKKLEMLDDTDWQ
ncbi:MAG: DNA recombination protein RmuC, partial [Eubacterium sp.]